MGVGGWWDRGGSGRGERGGERRRCALELEGLVGAEGGVLPLRPQPEPLLRGARAGEPPDLLLEELEVLLLQDADVVALLVRDEVEEALRPNLQREVGVGGEADHRVQVRLLPLLLLPRLLLRLDLELAADVERDVVLRELDVDLGDRRLPNVH